MAAKRKQISQIKESALKLYYRLQEKRIHADIIILFGSYAKGLATTDSDIDLCVVSRDFGHNPILEGAKVNLIATEIDPRFEVITVGLDDYLSRDLRSSIIHEVKRTGICLL